LAGVGANTDSRHSSASTRHLDGLSPAARDVLDDRQWAPGASSPA
jgi:hypothetical protein